MVIVIHFIDDDFIIVVCLLFVVKQNEQLRVAVVSGQRPDLSVITGGPETLIYLALGWIERCWHQHPDKRPSFTGILQKLFVSLDESDLNISCLNLTRVLVLLTMQLLVLYWNVSLL